MEVRDLDLREANKWKAGHLLDALEYDIMMAAESCQPFTKTGQNDPHARREELSAEIRDLGRHKLESLAQERLELGRVKGCVVKRSRVKNWLDVPGGDFANGLGEIVVGSQNDVSKEVEEN